MCIIAKGFAVFETHEHIAISVTFLSILLAFFTFAVVVPLAWLSYIYVEQPGIRTRENRPCKVAKHSHTPRAVQRSQPKVYLRSALTPPRVAWWYSTRR